MLCRADETGEGVYRRTPAAAPRIAPEPATAQTFPERGRNAVVDAANVIPDKQEEALGERLDAWERETGRQLVVATVPDLQGQPISDYAVGLFRHWRLGRAEANDGVLLLLAPNERRVRIEVGYGLEPTLTDGLTSQIMREAIVPDLESDPGAALSAGADRIMTAVNGAPAPGASATARTPTRLVGSAPADDGPSIFWILLLSFTPALLIVAILVWLLGRGRKPLPAGPVRALSKRAQARRENRENRKANVAAQGATWASDAPFTYQHLSSDTSSSSWSSSDSSWASSDSGGFDSGGGSSGGGGSDSSY